MTPENRKKLAARVASAAAAALAAKGYVSAIDVLVGIGWLEVASVERWRRRQIDYLERATQSNLSRISEAMKLFRSWAREKNLTASETHYVSYKPHRQTLRFSKSGNPGIEALYRTHWVSPRLSEKKRERVAEQAGRAPDPVVAEPPAPVDAPRDGETQRHG
jgi:hypothetical protein